MPQYDVNAAMRAGVPKDEILRVVQENGIYDVEGAKAAGISTESMLAALSRTKPGIGQGKATQGGYGLPVKAQEFSPYDYDQEIPPYLVDQAKQGVSNIASFIGLPVDVASAAMRAIGIPISDEPLLGSARTRRVAESIVGAPKGLKPPGFGSEFLGTLTRQTAETLLPGGIAAKLSAAPIQAALSQIPSLLYSSVGEEALGLGGEIVGGETGRRVGDLIGAAAGGLYGTGVSETARRGFGAAEDLFKGTTGKGGTAERRAGQELREVLSGRPEADLEIGEAENIAAKIREAGPFDPRLSQFTPATGLPEIEARVLGARPALLEEAKLKQDLMESTLADFARIEVPGVPLAVITGARKTTVDSLASIDRKVAALDAQRQTQPGVPQKLSGERLSGLLAERHKLSSGRVKAAEQMMYKTADDLGISDDLSDVAKYVSDVKAADENAFRSFPPVFHKILAGTETKAAAKDKYSFSGLHSLYKESNQEIGRAIRANDGYAQFQIRELKNLLKAKVKKYETDDFGDLSTQFQEFNQYYRTKHAPAFIEGVGGKIAAENRYGLAVPPSRVVKTFFTPEGIRDFGLIFGDNVDAQRTLQDGVIGLFKNAAVRRDGVINPARAKTWIANNAETLDLVPDIKRGLTDIAARNEILLASAERLRDRSALVSRSFLAQVSGSHDPVAVVTEALVDPQKMKALLAVPDSRMREGLAKGIAQVLPDVADAQGITTSDLLLSQPDKLREMLDGINPGHYDNLRTLAAGYEIAKRGGLPEISRTFGSRKDALREAIGVTQPSLAAQLRNYQIGRPGPVFITASLISTAYRTLGGRATDKVLADAIFDPDLARRLAGLGEKSTKASFADFNRQLVALGFRVGAESQNPQ